MNEYTHLGEQKYPLNIFVSIGIKAMKNESYADVGAQKYRPTYLYTWTL